MVVLEVCVESVAGVRAARAEGAERVEICQALGEGGLTPSGGLLAGACAVTGIEVVALARPRGGDFLYDEEELAILAHDVRRARELGAAGVALGCLTSDGRVDRARCERLCAEARGMRVTFHRAFDLVCEPLAALEELVELGVARVLTSGQAASAWDGRARLAELVRAARGRIEIVAAGSVRADHARALVAESGVPALHFAASERRESAMTYRNPRPRLAGARPAECFAHWETGREPIAALRAALRA